MWAYRSYQQSGAVALESALSFFFILMVTVMGFDLFTLARVSSSAQHVASVTARVGAVEVPYDGTGIPPTENQLKIGAGAYLPSWRDHKWDAEGNGGPAPDFSERVLRAMNLGLGQARQVFQRYETVQGFSKSDWDTGKPLPNRQFAVVPGHFGDSAPNAQVEYECCVGVQLTLLGLRTVCRSATMPQLF